MSDERRSEGGGAIVVIVVVLIIFGLVGIVGVGGGMWVLHRTNLLRMEAEDRRAMAEMMQAEMQAKAAALESMQELQNKMDHELKSPPTTHEVRLQIDAAGNYTLAGQPVKFEELVEALKKAKADQPEGLRLKIQAPTEAPFDLVEKAMKAGTEAGLIQQTVEVPPQPDTAPQTYTVPQP